MQAIYKEGRGAICPYLIPNKVYEVLDIEIMGDDGLFYYINDEYDGDGEYKEPTPHQAWLFDIVEE